MLQVALTFCGSPGGGGLLKIANQSESGTLQLGVCGGGGGLAHFKLPNQ